MELSAFSVASSKISSATFSVDQEEVAFTICRRDRCLCPRIEYSLLAPALGCAFKFNKVVNCNDDGDELNISILCNRRCR